jgi:hypothetical protein
MSWPLVAAPLMWALSPHGQCLDQALKEQLMVTGKSPLKKKKNYRFGCSIGSMAILGRISVFHSDW